MKMVDNLKSTFDISLLPLMKFYALLALLYLLAACENKQPSQSTTEDTTAAVPAKSAPVMNPKTNTDTLQYLHFEGNYDYWYGVFINSRKDTIQLVVNEAVPAKYRNKLVEVKWYTDSLSEAGDGERKYAGKRLKGIRTVNGPLFFAPITEAKVIRDIQNLPEVIANADQTGIAERPTDDKEYYLVETGSHDEDHFSRLYMFRVYVYPRYEIKIYDPGTNAELSLQEWRKKNQ